MAHLYIRQLLCRSTGHLVKPLVDCDWSWHPQVAQCRCKLLSLSSSLLHRAIVSHKLTIAEREELHAYCYRYQHRYGDADHLVPIFRHHALNLQTSQLVAQLCWNIQNLSHTNGDDDGFRHKGGAMKMHSMMRVLWGMRVAGYSYACSSIRLQSNVPGSKKLTRLPNDLVISGWLLYYEGVR